MIHNIEERQKLYERGFPDSGMLGEEELARLIEQVEEREMLHAPVHLKENVLIQIGRQKQTSQKLKLFSYRAKVLVGMAAALAVLFLVPVGGEETRGASQTEIIDRIFSQDREDVDEIMQGAVIRQQEIERTWQKYQKEQAREDAREEYLAGIESKIRNFYEGIF